MYIGTDFESLTRDEVIEILKARDGDFCFICKKEFIPGEERTLDHWRSKSWGYKNGWTPARLNHIDNLRLASKRCNARKGDKVPLDDITAPTTKNSTFQSRAVKRSDRPLICDTCMAGRILLPGENCDDCGSGPQPSMAPRALTVNPKECDHAIFNCWLCYLGFVPRRAAIVTVLDGEILE